MSSALASPTVAPPAFAAPAFAAETAASLPLWAVPSEGLAAFLQAGEGGDGISPAQAAWLKATGFAAGAGELRLLPGPDGALIGAVAGLGSATARARGRFGLARAQAALPAGSVWHLASDLAPEVATEAALGWLLASYRFDRYRPGKTTVPPATLKAPKGVDAARITAMAAAECLTRDLINTPSQDMGPEELETAFLSLAQTFGATTNVIRGEDLLAQNFPMIHAVGRASTRAPRLLELNWGHTGPLLILVGKGVCFDTGGLDLKPAANMLLMKKDMGGAATTMGLAQAIMTLNLPLRLKLLVPAVENAVSGNAFRPRDILTSRKGLTVEVNNTDAEGRLVLGDALAYGAESQPDLMISMATLTGAARVAVGPDLAPYFTDDAHDAAAIAAGGATGFDPVWRLPFHDAYEPMIEPGIADLDNAPSGGFAGAITAALFLRRFADHPRYMHFDIYGHMPSDAPARPKGGAGQGARAILNALPQMLGL